ncbi:MAG: ribonuclease III, partial [Deltaproteobacteria bacterium]|nr:ribonuclease III [Deltaproteobacteria bacterium]
RPAEVYILLCCTITGAADRDTRKLVARLRRSRPQARIVVSGCLAEADPDRAGVIAGVWRVVSHHRLPEIPALLLELATATGAAPAVPSEPVASAPDERAESEATAALRPLRRGLDRPFLKVQDGCNTGCSYCILPRARGRSRSIPLLEVLRELDQLEQQGVQEVVLTGINLGSWGRDLAPQQSLAHLLEAIFRATVLSRVRLSSIEPEALGPEVLDLLAGAPCFCRHLHVPLQSGDDEVLARMRRRYRAAEYEEIVARALERLSGLALGTDVIAGFPGEEPAAHQRTCALFERIPFAYLHVFTYSERKGAPAAALADDVDPREKKRRTSELIALGRQARRRACAQAVGRPAEVLIERRRDPGSGLLTGYSREYLGVLLEEPTAGDALLGRIVQAQGLASQGERLLARMTGGSGSPGRGPARSMSEDEPTTIPPPFPLAPDQLQQRIGYRFTEPALLQAALTHSSFLNEHPEPGGQDNQRLEFLGDAVVQLVVSQELIRECTDQPEGQLTKMRAGVVSGSGLAAAARRLDLGGFLLLGRGEERSGGREKDSLLADAFEALAGALFLDGGFGEARRIILPLLGEQIDGVLRARSLLDSKSRLQELTQSRFACTPHYVVVGEEGPDHAKAFVVQALLAGNVWGVGMGPTKRAAEQAAASQVLARLDEALTQDRQIRLEEPPALAQLEQEARRGQG